MGAATPSILDRLVGALAAAQTSLRLGHQREGYAALQEAFALLGALYASLDSASHPELSDYLHTVYDRCLQRIGEARPGDSEGLSVAIVLCNQVRTAQGGAPSAWGVERRPSSERIAVHHPSSAAPA